MKQIKAGIIGGAGYTGGELIRILINHTDAEITFVWSKSNAGKPVSEIHKDLAGETPLFFSDLNVGGDFKDIDVLFLCVGHGDARKFIDKAHLPLNLKVIDLSQDYRLSINGQRPSLNDQSFVYGLPEINKSAIQNAAHIANPGCFATAIQLGLLPLAGAGLLKDVYTTGITGSTGAGQGLSPTAHFSWRANNIQAYKSLQHQHVKEITQSLQQLQPSFTSSGENPGLHFVPWRGDFTRGIYVSSTTECPLSYEAVLQLYKEFYADQPFTWVSDNMIDLKQVVNTNKCLIHIEKAGSKVVVHTAMDNLLKGASGQAVQNMNLMFGLDETTGLKLKANFF